VGSSFSQNLRCSFDLDDDIRVYNLTYSTSDASGVLASSSTTLENIGEQIPGCVDATACNLDADATYDDGSCWYAADGCACENGQGASNDDCGVCDTDSSNDNDTCSGCTDDGNQSDSPYPGTSADNYDASATIDDGGCTYPACSEIAGFSGVTLIGESSSDGCDGDISISEFFSGSEKMSIAAGAWGDSVAVYSCLADDNTYLLSSACSSASASAVADATADTTAITLASVSGSSSAWFGTGTFTAPIEGCTDATAANYDDSAQFEDGSCAAFGSSCAYPYADTLASSGTIAAGDATWKQIVATVTGYMTVEAYAGYYNALLLSVYETDDACDDADMLASYLGYLFAPTSQTFEVVAGRSYSILMAGNYYTSFSSTFYPVDYTITEESYPTAPSIASVTSGAGSNSIDFASMDPSVFDVASRANIRLHNIESSNIVDINEKPSDMVDINEFISNISDTDLNSVSNENFGTGYDLESLYNYYLKTGNKSVFDQVTEIEDVERLGQMLSNYEKDMVYLNSPLPEGNSGAEFEVSDTENDSRSRASITITMSGGSYSGERFWVLSEDTSINGNGNGTWNIDLDDGATYTLLLGDSYGDTWNGGTLTVSQGATTLLSTTGPASGCDCGSSSSFYSDYCPDNTASGCFASESFTTGSSVEGCTDANASNTDPNANAACADDDSDGYPDCCTYDAEQGCANSVDEDGDGLVDCADDDCSADTACVAGGVCSNPIAAVEGSNNVDYNGNGSDQWFVFSASSGGVLDISSCTGNNNNSDHDATLYGYEEGCDAASSIASGDLGSTACPDNSYAAGFSVNLSQATDFIFKWADNYSPDPHDFNVSFSAVIEGCTDSDASNYNSEANTSCIDADSDGYADCCTYSAEQDCGDGADEDGDSLTDCDDDDCSSQNACIPGLTTGNPYVLSNGDTSPNFVVGEYSPDAYFAVNVTEADIAEEAIWFTISTDIDADFRWYGTDNSYSSLATDYLWTYVSSDGEIITKDLDAAGTYYFAIDGYSWASTNVSASYTAGTPPKADLSATAVWNGETSQLDVTISNTGDASASGFYTYLYLGHSTPDCESTTGYITSLYTSSVSAGGTSTSSITGMDAVYGYGDLDITIFTDQQCDVTELDETNNISNLTVTIDDPDNGTSFNVYADGAIIATVGVVTGSQSTDYLDDGLADLTEVCYTVSQILSDSDCALVPGCTNNESNQSDSVCSTTWAAAPSDPTITLTSDIDARTVLVDWDANSDYDASYTVYQWIESPACNPGFVLDCAGNCVDSNYASQDTWLGDGYCDCDPGDDGAGPNGSCPDGYPTQTNGESAWGIDFYCEEWNWDYGDCGDTLGRISSTDGMNLNSKEVAVVYEPVVEESRDSETWVAIATITDDTQYLVSGYDEGCFDVVITDSFGQSSASPSTEIGSSDGTCIDVCNQALGDINDDEVLNVLDIVSMINYILSGSGLSECQLQASDLNSDSVINILDVVQLVNTVVNGRIDFEDASSATIINTDEMINVNAKGYIGAVQMTLTHGPDFEFVITDKAFVSSYHQDGNMTKLMVVLPKGDELLTISSGTYEIEEVVVANSFDQIDVVIAPRDFSLGTAYPNPFNPVTSMQVAMPQEGFASVKVFDVLGREIATLVDGNLEAKLHVITWNASNISSGVYFVRAIAGESVQTQKIMLMK